MKVFNSSRGSPKLPVEIAHTITNAIPPRAIPLFMIFGPRSEVFPQADVGPVVFAVRTSRLGVDRPRAKRDVENNTQTECRSRRVDWPPKSCPSGVVERGSVWPLDCPWDNVPDGSVELCVGRARLRMERAD